MSFTENECFSVFQWNLESNKLGLRHFVFRHDRGVQLGQGGSQFVPSITPRETWKEKKTRKDERESRKRTVMQMSEKERAGWTRGEAGGRMRNEPARFRGISKVTRKSGARALLGMGGHSRDVTSQRPWHSLCGRWRRGNGRNIDQFPQRNLRFFFFWIITFFV